VFGLPVVASQIEKQTAPEQAVLHIQGSDGITLGNCSKSLQNCLIQITQNNTACLVQPGSITITNNSNVIAQNIQASSSNSNFMTYVVQNNGCPASLFPGASCIISFFTNAAVTFTIPNVQVNGTNTNATFFNIQAFPCTITTPGAPTITSTISGNSAVTVSWTAPANNGGSPITGYTVTSSPGNFTCTTTGATSCNVTGLTNGTAYTFTVTATNAAGTGPASAPGGPATPNAADTVANRVTNLTSAAGNGQAILSWTPPANTGGSFITGYTITPFIGTTPLTPITVSGSTLNKTITGLTNGTTYNFTISALTPSGVGMPASFSPVTPSAGVVLNPATLALSGLGGGADRSITVTNTTNNPITITQTPTGANFVPALPAGTTVLTTTCTIGTVLAAQTGSCTVTITPGATATSACTTGIAPTPSVFTLLTSVGNVTSQVVVLGYGCIYQGGYVFSINDTTQTTVGISGTVASVQDQEVTPPGVIWSSNGAGGTNPDVDFSQIWGIDDTSNTFTPSPGSPTATLFQGQVNCDGVNDGPCDTNNIVVFYSPPHTNPAVNLNFYAAGFCKKTIDSSGNSPCSVGTCYSDWYLPAICELGPFSNSGSGTCVSLTMNMQVQLFEASIGGFASGSNYWSATTSLVNNPLMAWFESFVTSSSTQLTDLKRSQDSVRCVRTITS
jgi:hypothetical protein